jgi:hypothetical protein
MTRCNNTIQFYYADRMREGRCGQTSPFDGMPMICGECQKKVLDGEMNQPGYCRHGNRLHDDHDNDLYCDLCEAGE